MPDILNIDPLIQSFGDDIEALPDILKINYEDLNIPDIGKCSLSQNHVFLTWDSLRPSPEDSTLGRSGKTAWRFTVNVDLVMRSPRDNVLVNDVYVAIKGNPRRRSADNVVQAQKTEVIDFVRVTVEGKVLVIMQFEVLYLEG